MESRITIEPGKRSGQPCIRGLRITVWDLLGWLAEGMKKEKKQRLLATFIYFFLPFPLTKLAKSA
jgi:uncharacterized protein (DUF433 family)